jgi:hypothetical protein
MSRSSSLPSFDRDGSFFFLAFDVAVDFGEDEVGGQEGDEGGEGDYGCGDGGPYFL